MFIKTKIMKVNKDVSCYQNHRRCIYHANKCQNANNCWHCNIYKHVFFFFEAWTKWLALLYTCSHFMLAVHTGKALMHTLKVQYLDLNICWVNIDYAEPFTH